MHIIAITLTAARVNAHLTQAQAAEILHISVPTLANWEKKKTFPDVRQAKEMADLYGVSVNDIFFNE